MDFTNSCMRACVSSAMISLVAGTSLASDPVFFSWNRQNDGSNPTLTQIPASGTTAHYTYCPQPGGAHGWGLGTSNTYVHDIWDQMVGVSQPVALMMRDRNSPWGTGPSWDSLVDYPYSGMHTPSPIQLAHAVVDRSLASGQINYVIADLEAHGYTNAEIDQWMANIVEIVNGDYSGGVTGDPDGSGSTNIPQSTIQAWDTPWVGNYSTHRYPKLNYGGTITRTDVTAAWIGNGQSTIHTGRHNTFVDNDLNMLMPVTYAYAAHIIHTSMSHWSGETSPNVRAAYLWAGVERQSSAIREELTATGTMNDKQVIPWVTPFVHSGYDPQSGTYAGCWMPPSADFLATIKHLRLRGADGFFFWGQTANLAPGGTFDDDFWSVTDGSGTHLNPWYAAGEDWADASASPNGYEWFEANALISWEELDGTFSDDAVPYRFETDKESGIVVSAMNDMGQLHILVSYMKPTPSPGVMAIIDLDDYFPEARDYRTGSGVSTVGASGFSHSLNEEFFTPDIDGDFDADGDDATAWVALYTAADPRADWNQDGIFDATDISLFTNAANNYP